jgi:hypothetical protein
MGAIAEPLQKSKGFTCMKVKCVGFEEEGREKFVPSSTYARPS